MLGDEVVQPVAVDKAREVGAGGGGVGDGAGDHDALCAAAAAGEQAHGADDLEDERGQTRGPVAVRGLGVAARQVGGGEVGGEDAVHLHEVADGQVDVVGVAGHGHAVKLAHVGDAQHALGQTGERPCAHARAAQVGELSALGVDEGRAGADAGHDDVVAAGKPSGPAADSLGLGDVYRCDTQRLKPGASGRKPAYCHGLGRAQVETQPFAERGDVRSAPVLIVREDDLVALERRQLYGGRAQVYADDHWRTSLNQPELENFRCIRPARRPRTCGGGAELQGRLWRAVSACCAF